MEIRSYTFRDSLFTLRQNRKPETDIFVSEVSILIKFASLHFANIEKGTSGYMKKQPLWQSTLFDNHGSP